MAHKTSVIGVGMTKFDKPGTKEGDYPRRRARRRWPTPASVMTPSGQTYAGYVYGDSTYGQRPSTASG